jgi:hypothetical protein
LSSLLKALIALLLVLLVAPARADEPDQPQVETAAEALFLEGRKLMAEGQIEEACKRFEESRRIEAAIGTTMNLARCYLKLGRTASAWLLYREAAANARALGQLDREEHARSELLAIEPDLAKLVIRAEPALLSDRRVQVLLDGSVVPSSVVGSEVPVDPGSHQIVVHTTRAELWSGKAEVGARQTQEVVIPHLEVPPDPPPPGPPLPAPTVEKARSQPARPIESDGLTTRRKVALVFGGAAALSAGYAIFETFRAASANDASDPDTCKEGTTCSQTAIDNRERAFERAGRATIAAGISGACLASAGVLWVLGAPPEQPVSGHATASGWFLSYRRNW